MGVLSSVDFVPPVFSGTSLGISGGVSRSFPFPVSDYFVWEPSVSWEGILVSFIFPLGFSLSCVFVSNPGGGPSCSGGVVETSPCKLLGRELRLWHWNDTNLVYESGGMACTLFITSS
jgi:hypothetical protein